MSKLLENCDAHRFETIVQVPVGALVKRSRVRVCGTRGQSDADWVRTLKDAVGKTERNAQMPKAVRDQIVAALNGEIARLTLFGATGALSLPQSAAKTPVLDGLSTLPPLPETKRADSAARLPSPRIVAPAERVPQYSVLPSLPTTTPAPPHVLTEGLSGSLPQLPKPRVRLVCYNPGDVGEAPCAEFARDTLVTVEADEDIPIGTSLRFVRNGDARADVALARLDKGKSQRFALPPEVCSHVSGATLEIRFVRNVPAAGASGQEVGTEGPYNLRC